jgi:hypothetical protein
LISLTTTRTALKLSSVDNINRVQSNRHIAIEKTVKPQKKVCTDSVDNFVIKPAAMALSHCFVINLPPLPNPRAASCLVNEFPTVYVDKPSSNDIINPATY